MRPASGEVVWFIANAIDAAMFRALLEAFARQIGAGPDKHVILVLDGAYAEYVTDSAYEDGLELAREEPNVVCTRTFSKIHGLAALRIGYALASPEVADALDRVRPVFNVNQPAQEAALASLAEDGAVATRVEHARRGRRFLEETLRNAGLDPVPSQANFVYADVPGGDGAGVTERLLGHGVLVRALGGFGAPGAIRVTAGTDEENEIFATALREVAAG